MSVDWIGERTSPEHKIECWKIELEHGTVVFSAVRPHRSTTGDSVVCAAVVPKPLGPGEPSHLGPQFGEETRRVINSTRAAEIRLMSQTEKDWIQTCVTHTYEAQGLPIPPEVQAVVDRLTAR